MLTGYFMAFPKNFLEMKNSYSGILIDKYLFREMLRQSNATIRLGL